MQPLTAADPHQVGPYLLEGRLGGGGMGQVYLGRSRGGRRVAVKVIHPQFAAEPDFRGRFRREVELAMKVGGFWTAALVDSDPEAAEPWVASEYVPGPTLRQRIVADGPLGLGPLRELAVGLAEAVAAVHRGGWCIGI
ncbi:hypothetical protein BIV57_10925 [Mangrovactinospora gilvigrisea]|uniref:Protein kinase domain-containing protein n=1 Tax=Mangrovactinospora gilvigrisea TaxID=1428644 RepID=A0A1J7BVG3_9ACTN|nr:hypothetical protein [Mangrovactinospora gilvigrisea]OIV37473.1 hypothetical protein BIV57_10925 [Mangrovactinospora gilvigrisea]